MENNNHKVLALKYRPKNFNELIGQNIMVETIINSIKFNKIPNAYLLTGIRGVGKTTTARLIAKAINCNKNFIDNKKDEYCDCSSCEEITKSKHLDVLEMDAASKTGIDDIRELIDSSKYKPTSAKFKVIILDEVHMLSKQAFNGLLKTLEEPPQHLKFIFATTEVKKIPVTIISRCQRFDLHRVPIKDLVENLNKISKIENGKISNEALILIAKAAEGSVRDSLSLLDKALISQNIQEKEIDDTFIRKMLGVVDKSKILNLLKFIFNGEQEKSIDQLRKLINEGIDPNNFLNDFLEIIYLLQQKKTLGNLDGELSISESEKEIINSISENVNMPTLIVFWQFILKVIEELSVVSNPILSLEMLVVRLVYLKDMPSYESVINLINKSDSNNLEEDNRIEIKTNNQKKTIDENMITTKISKAQIKNTVQTKPIPSTLEPENLSIANKNDLKEKVSSFEDLIYLSSKKKEIQLKYDLEKNVNLIKFSQGKIDISFNQNLDKNFVRNLSEKLLEWTDYRWVITLSKEKGQKTFLELKDIEEKKLIQKAKESDVYKKFTTTFSDGELLEVEESK